MTTLHAIAERLADIRCISLSTDTNLVVEQFVTADLAVGTITDPGNIDDAEGSSLLVEADEAYSAAGKLAMGETVQLSEVTIFPTREI
ncbi:hypothetical protein [Corynebacterium provencense]|uniref:hypothetical protein n=1 Tax=Corynebacterium provencense TaxID=1737425 RepID=UPI000830A5C5|nr:hypothetical protein [Corynebacterium provencense]